MTQGPIGEAHILVVPELRAFASRLNAELTAAMRGVRDPKIHASVDVDRSSLRGASRDVDLFSRRSKAAFSGLRREVFNSNIRLREMANILGGATLPVLASLASVGVAAFGSLAAAAGAAAAAIAVLPGLIAAAVQGASVIGLAFSGIGDAVKAMGAAQTQAGRGAASSARQQATAANSIRDAQQALGRASRDAALANEDATRRVRDATRNLADSQREARQAQLDLNGARREARDGLIDLRLEESRLALDIREAALSRTEAEAELQRVIASPNSTAIDRQRAQLRAEQARLAERDIRRRIELNRREIREGVEGSDQVRSARERLAGTNERVRDAARGVADAEREAARQRVQSAEQVIDAQRRLADAQTQAATAAAGAAGGVDKLGEAMSKLSPPAQRFARFLFSLKPRLDELKAVAAGGFLPGLETGIRALVGAHFPALRRIVDATAKTLGRLAVEGGKMMSTGPWRKDFETIGRDNVRLIDQFGHVGLNLADALRNVMIAARPLTKMIGDMALKWSENIRGAAEAGRETGKLGKFFEQAGKALKSLLRIAGNVGATIFAVLSAAFPSGVGLLGSLEKATGRMRELATSSEGLRNMREFFERAKPAIETVAGLFVILARKIFEVVVHVKNVTERIAEFLDKHPELKDLLGTALALALAFKAFNVAGLLGVVGAIGQIVAFNPVLALVAGAVLAIGAAFVYAYNASPEFKKTVDDLGRTLKDTVLPALKSFGRFIKEDVVPALKEAIPFIRDQLVAGLDFLFQAFEDNKEELKLFGSALLAVGKFIFVTVIPAIAKLAAVHLRALFTSFGIIIGVIGVLVRVFRVMVSGILAGFQTVLDAAVSAFGWLPIIGPQLKTAQAKFREFAKGVNAALDGINDKKVTVTATGALKLPKGISVRDLVGKIPGQATGGPIEGAGPKGRDSLLRWVAPGEHMLTAQEVDRAGGHSAIYALRAAIRQGWRVPGLASGGAAEDAPRGLNVVARTSTSRLEEGVSQFDRLLNRVAVGLAQRIAGATPQASGALSGAKFGGGAMHYIAKFIREAGVAFQIISGFRPGARTRGTGSVSLHSLGRALDLVGSGKSSMMDIWAAATRIPFKKEVIFSPAPFQVYGRGKHPGPPTNPRTRADHYNHVHVGLFDRGGFLMPGLTLAENRSGRPEKVTPATRDAAGRLSFGQGVHVENLIVQPLSGQFRLRDVMTELRLQGVH